MSAFSLVCVLADFFVQIYFFVPMMVIDAQRRQAGMGDGALWCLACCGAGKRRLKPVTSSPAPKAGGVIPEGAGGHPEPNKCLGSCLGPLIVNRCCSMLIISVALLVAIAGAGSTDLLDIGMDITSVFPPESESGVWARVEKVWALNVVLPLMT